MQAAQAKSFAASPLFSALRAVELMASGYVPPQAAKAFLARGIRPVTGPEFDEYFLHESPFPGIHVQVPEA